MPGLAEYQIGRVAFHPQYLTRARRASQSDVQRKEKKEEPDKTNRYKRKETLNLIDR